LVTVRTTEPVPYLSDQVRELFPQAELLQVVEDCEARRLTILRPSDLANEAEPSFTEMFRDYLATQGTRGAHADDVMRTFDALLRAVEQEEEPAFAEMALLQEQLTDGSATS
jgi:exonuclease SbcD